MIIKTEKFTYVSPEICLTTLDNMEVICTSVNFGDGGSAGDDITLEDFTL